MITKEELILKGFTEPEYISFYNQGCLEKSIGRYTYTIGFNFKIDCITITLFIPQNPNNLWSMSTWCRLYVGRCPDVKTFDYIFDLVWDYK